MFIKLSININEIRFYMFPLPASPPSTSTPPSSNHQDDNDQMTGGQEPKASSAARGALKRSADSFREEHSSLTDDNGDRVVRQRIDDPNADIIPVSLSPVSGTRAESSGKRSERSLPESDVDQPKTKKPDQKETSSIVGGDFTQLPTTQANEPSESEPPFFTFNSDLTDQAKVWTRLEEELNNNQGSDDDLCLVEDLDKSQVETGRQIKLPLSLLHIKLPLSLLRSLVALYKNRSEHNPPISALNFAHLTRCFQITDKAGQVHTIPVAEIWEASGTFRQMYSGVKLEMDPSTGHLLFPECKRDVTLLPHLFNPDPAHIEQFDLPQLYVLWSEANYLDAPKITTKITNAIGKKIDACSVETLNNLKVLGQISVLAKQTVCKELREKLKALVQRSFDKTCRDINALRSVDALTDSLKRIQGVAVDASNFEKWSAKFTSISQKIIDNKRLKITKEQELLNQWSIIADCLKPVTLETNLTDTEIELIKRAPCIDTLVCLDIEDADLKNLVRSSPKIHGIFIKSSRITNAGLKYISTLKALQKLSLDGCLLITDAGLAHLSSLTALQTLALEGCYRYLITDAGLAQLKSLTELHKLDLGLCGKITDDGVAHLKSFTALHTLTLGGCGNITDAGVDHLKSLAALHTVDVGDCENIEEPFAWRDFFLKRKRGLTQ